MNGIHYINLTPKEKSEFVGQLVHSCQSDVYLYSLGQEIIKLAKRRGLFKNVVINPEQKTNEDEN